MGRILALLLLIAVPGAVLLGLGAFYSVGAARDRLIADKRAADLRTLEATAAGLRDITHQSMKKAAQEFAGGPERAFAAACDPLCALLGVDGTLLTPAPTPLIRTEDLRNSLVGPVRQRFDVAQSFLDEGLSASTRAYLAAMERAGPEALSAFARFHLRREDPALPFLHSEENPTTSSPNSLLADWTQQISAHRHEIRMQQAMAASAENDLAIARQLLSDAVRELAPAVLAGESVAADWLTTLAHGLATVLPEAPTIARDTLTRVASTSRRLPWLPLAPPRTAGFVLVGEREVFVKPLVQPDGTRKGTLLVLPPETPALSDVATATLRLLPRDTAAPAPINTRLAPLFPEWILAVPESAPEESLVPWGALLVAASLLLGLFVVGTGVTLAFRSIALRERLNAERTTLLATLSHQLRTPAANVRLFAETLRDRALDAEERERMQGILQEEASRLGDVVDRLLAYQRTEETAADDRSIVALAQVIASRQALWTRMAAMRGVRCEIFVQESLPTIRGDEQSLRDALDNLVDNGIKASSDGGTLTVRALHRDSRVILEVEDRGSGIADGDVAHVFERFYRGKDREARAGNGSGLGLAIVAKVARSHGGHAEVATTSETGTVMRMTFPFPGDSDHGDDSARRG